MMLRLPSIANVYDAVSILFLISKQNPVAMETTLPTFVKKTVTRNRSNPDTTTQRKDIKEAMEALMASMTSLKPLKVKETSLTLSYIWLHSCQLQANNNVNINPPPLPLPPSRSSLSLPS